MPWRRVSLIFNSWSKWRCRSASALSVCLATSSLQLEWMHVVICYRTSTGVRFDVAIMTAPGGGTSTWNPCALNNTSCCCCFGGGRDCCGSEGGCRSLVAITAEPSSAIMFKQRSRPRAAAASEFTYTTIRMKKTTAMKWMSTVKKYPRKDVKLRELQGTQSEFSIIKNKTHLNHRAMSTRYIVHKPHLELIDGQVERRRWTDCSAERMRENLRTIDATNEELIKTMQSEQNWKFILENNRNCFGANLIIA